MNIKLKRAYDDPSPADGIRILVDRLWPRGVPKSAAKLDLWLKEIAPSTALRKWFGHDPAKWTEFKKRYHRELKQNSEAVAQLKKQLHHKTVTLIYGAKDTDHNQAVALKDYLASSSAK